MITHICVRNGNLRLAIADRRRFGGQGISGPCCGQLGNRPHITGMKLLYFDRLVALHHIQFAYFLFCILILIVDHIIRLEYTRTDLDQRVFADKRIHDRLENIGRFCLGKIIIRLEYFIALHVYARDLSVFRAGEIFYDIIQQCVYTLAEYIGTHRHGHNRTIHNVEADCSTYLRLGECFPCKVPVHKLFTGFRNGFHQCIPANLQIGLTVLRNLAVNHFFVFPSVACLTDDIDISYKFFIFTDRQVERRHLFAVFIGHILHYLSVGSIVHIHIRYKYHTGQFIFLT